MSELPSPSPRYRAESILGRGAFGQVVRARDLELDRPVAIKWLVRSGEAGGPAAVRFQREARLTAEVSHPNLVGVYEAGETAEGELYIVYEFVEGTTLDEALADVRPGDLDRVLGHGVAVARALHTLHGVGVLHRDVKPANILVDGAGRAVLCDLGLARRVEETLQLTNTGALVGTPRYMAPEIVIGHPATAASDQYSWAGALFEVVYGAPPVPAKTAAQLFTLLQEEHEVRLRDTARERCPALADVLLRGLSWRPEARFPDMGAFADALEAIDPAGVDLPAGSGVRAGSMVELPAYPGLDVAAAGARDAGATPPRGPRPLLPATLALVAAVFLGAFLLSRDPPGPPGVDGAVDAYTQEAGPAGTEGPDPALRVALERALDEQLTAHRGPDGEPDLDLPTRAHRLAAGMDDPRFPMRLRRYLDTLARWLADLEGRGGPAAWEDPANEDLLRRAAFWLAAHVVSEALGTSRTEVNIMDDDFDLGALGTEDRGDALRGEVRGAVEGFVADLREGRDRVPLVDLAIAADLLGRAGSPLVAAAVTELAARLGEDGPAAAREVAATAAARVLVVVTDRGLLPCASRGRVVDALHDLVATPGSLPPRRAAPVLADALLASCLAAEACATETGPPAEARVHALLDLAGSRRKERPADFRDPLRRALAEYRELDRKDLLMGALPGKLHPRLDALERDLGVRSGR